MVVETQQQQQPSRRTAKVAGKSFIVCIAIGLLSVSVLIFDFSTTVRQTYVAHVAIPSMGASATVVSTLPLFLVQSFTNGTHHADQRRTVLSFTTVPDELSQLAGMVKQMMLDPQYKIFDAIHINIPWIAMRFHGKRFPHTREIFQLFENDPRIIVNRLMDYGPMTRYIGALGFEKHPETTIIVHDIDTDQGQIQTLKNLLRASQELDPNSVWCNYGEDFTYLNNTFEPFWFTYDAHWTDDKELAWNEVYFCRGSRGLLVKPKFFVQFALNATDYHHSCFWDDDRFISFQMALSGIPRKNIHPASWYDDEYRPQKERRKQECQDKKKRKAESLVGEVARQQRRRLGSLSDVNNANKPDIHCTNAFITAHPNLFPLATNETFHCVTI